MLMCVWSAQLAKASMLQAPYLQASCQGGRIHQRLQHAEESQDPRGQYNSDAASSYETHPVKMHHEQDLELTWSKLVQHYMQHRTPAAVADPDDDIIACLGQDLQCSYIS